MSSGFITPLYHGEEFAYFLLAFLFYELCWFLVISGFGIYGLIKRERPWIYASIGGHLVFLVFVSLIRFQLEPSPSGTYWMLAFLYLVLPICSFGGFLLGRRHGKRQDKSNPFGGGFERFAVMLGVVGIVMVNFFVLTDPILGYSAVADSYQEIKQARKIINGIRTGSVAESACEQMRTHSSLCYAVAAIQYRTKETCIRIVSEGQPIWCKHLVQDARDDRLDKESCDRGDFRVGWHSQCYAWLGVYLEDKQLCSKSGTSGTCNRYLGGLLGGLLEAVWAGPYL